MAASKGISRKNVLFIIIGALLFFLILWCRPFSLSFSQSFSFAAVIFVLFCWATNCIKRIYVSIFLLLFFLVFSGVKPAAILKFPLSPNFYLIIASFLLSECVTKSKLTTRISDALLKYCKTPMHFVEMAFLLNIILLFLMPQPYPRVIILTAIYAVYLKDRNLPAKTSQIIILSIFIASTCCSMFFLNGDVLLNYAALSFSKVELTWGGWAKYMLLPSIVTTVIMFFLFPVVFRKELLLKPEEYTIPKTNAPAERKPFSKAEKLSGGILLIVILLWATESIHGINPAIVGILGVLVMFCFRLLSFSDFKCINIDVMVFITAAFSIGAVLTGNKTGVQIFTFLSRYVTTDFLGNGGYNLLIVSLLTIAFHMLLGSVVATLSVVLPCMLASGASYNLALSVALTAYTTGAIHYILPFHQTTVMLGMGTGAGYTSRQVVRYGLFMTMLVIPIVAFLFIPWWKLLGLF